MSDRIPILIAPALDANGDPINGSKLKFFITETTTPKAVYTDADKTASATEITADAAGRFGNIFGDTDVAYKIQWTDASDVVIATYDPVVPIPASQVTETPVVSKSSNFTVLTTERGSLFEVDASSGSVNATLPAAATAGNNFEITIKKIDSSSNAVTVDGNGAETIDGETTQTLSNQYDAITIVCDGTEWLIKSENDASATNPLPPDYSSGLTLSNNGADSEHDLDIAAGECRDSADGVNIELTSSLTKQIDASWVAGTDQGGLSSSLTLAASTVYYVHAIIVGGSADIGFDTSITAANLVTDHSATAYRLIGQVVTDGSSNIVNGQFMQVTRGGKTFTFAEQATTSGTAFDWIGIDPDVRRINVKFEGVSLDGTDSLLVQIGDSGGLETTGYVSTTVSLSGSGSSDLNSTSGFIIRAGNAARVVSGRLVLENISGDGLTWVASGTLKYDTNTVVMSAGNKTLSAVLDRVRITRSGTDNFDAGSVNISVEA